MISIIVCFTFYEACEIYFFQVNLSVNLPASRCFKMLDDTQEEFNELNDIPMHDQIDKCDQKAPSTKQYMRNQPLIKRYQFKDK